MPLCAGKCKILLYAVSISYNPSFIVHLIVQFLCIIYLKNTFWMYTFYIFYFLGFILQLIILSLKLES